MTNVCPTNEDDSIDDDRDGWSPFAGIEVDLFAVDSAANNDDGTTKHSPQRRPDWGIPTFHEQCNGHNTFVLHRVDERGAKKITATTQAEAELPLPQDSVGLDGCCCDGMRLRRHPRKDSVSVLLEHRRNSTGSDLWEAALVLAHALERPIPLCSIDNSNFSVINATASTPAKTLWENAETVLELGSGTGALGLFAAHVLGARAVLLTDLPANLDLLRTNRNRNISSSVSVRRSDDNYYNTNEKCDYNCETNNCPSPDGVVVDVMALDWTDRSLPDMAMVEWKRTHAPNGIDLILGSDLFLPFAPHLLDPLAQTIRDLLWALGHATSCAMVAYEERFDCSDFFSCCSTYGLVVEQIPDDWLHPDFQDPGRIHVLQIRMQI